MVRQQNVRVVVIGGGIMGASAAWHLARVGAKVSLIERHPALEHGVTASSYGWVGTSAHLPSNGLAAFALRLQAIQEFARLEQDLGSLPLAARGALAWCPTEEVTAALIAEQQAAGVHIKGLARAIITDREPRVAAPPALAAWAPDDFAVEPAILARQFLASAKAHGAVVHQGSVEALEMAGGRVVGVRMEGETISVDIAILANGFEARSLAAKVGLELPLEKAPAVLVRYAAEPGLIRHLLYGPGLEVRPTMGGGLTLAADYPENGQEGLAWLAVHSAAAISDFLALPTPPPLLSVTAAHRPMTRDGTPLRGFVAGIEGLYALVAHPGVVLAPLLGRLAAEEIIGSRPG